ncbi:MAG: response regulator [Candidatus Margulisbacteria bacterium]|jgi:DNA-binding NtrC family response regulator|nr:response regulator [Candidatus Margulisiibacteriota bacterium]
MKKILVVDDEKNIRKTFQKLLEADGYLVDTAENGAESLAKAARTKYAAALLDIQLPDMLGTRLLKELKKIQPDMVKIMVTGDPAVQNAVDALNDGAEAYIRKPIHKEQLLAVIKEKLAR